MNYLNNFRFIGHEFYSIVVKDQSRHDEINVEKSSLGSVQLRSSNY